MRAQRASVAKLGGLPCISKPILKIFAANHTESAAEARPTSTVAPTCHAGGGVLVASLANMANWVSKDIIGVLNGEPPLNPVNDPAEVNSIRKKLGLTPLFRS